MKLKALLISLFACATIFASSDEAYLKTDYYPNGNLKYAGYAVQHPELGEVPHGYWQYFYPNGFLKMAGNFKEGYRNKVWTNWFENGSVESYGSYSKGLKDGRWHMFYPSGAKMAEGKFSDDLAKGTWTYWHTNGVVETEGDFKEGKRVGKRTYYDARGNKLWYGRFDNDQKVGDWKLEEKGKLTTQSYKAGVMVGQKEEIFYPNDDVKQRTEYEVIFGQLTGSSIVTTFDEDENMTSQGLVYNGTPYGVWRYFEEKGKMTQQDNGQVPGGLQERREALKAAEQEAIRKAQLAAQQKENPQAQAFSQNQGTVYSDEPFEYGPRQFKVIMQAPQQLNMTATSESGKSVNLNDNNYDVVKENPMSFEALRQQALRAQAAKMTESVGEEEEK